MKRFYLVALPAMALAFSFGTSAAKPTSITFESHGTSPEGVEYTVYRVECSNASSVKLSAWDKRKKWCLGEGKAEDCQRKQIKAAKKACR